MDIKLNKSKFNKATSTNGTEVHVPVEVKVKSNIIEVYLTNNSQYTIDFSIKNKYRIKKNCLYHGLFHKLGHIAYIEVKEVR